MITTGISIYLYLYHLSPILAETMINHDPHECINTLTTATVIFLLILVIIMSIGNYMWMKFNECAIEAGKLEFAYNQQNDFLLGVFP